MILLSITGLLRTILIIVGVVVIARFIGRLMIAKRNIDAQNQMNREMDEQAKMMDDARKNYGKTSLTNFKDSGEGAEFVDYEEVDD